MFSRHVIMTPNRLFPLGALPSTLTVADAAVPCLIGKIPHQEV